MIVFEVDIDSKNIGRAKIKVFIGVTLTQQASLHLAVEIFHCETGAVRPPRTSLT